MSFHGTLPHWFLLIIVIVVAWFILKALIKFAIIIGLVGLAIYLLWVFDVFDRISGSITTSGYA